MTSLVPRLNRRVFTVFLLVGLPLLAAGVVMVLAAGRTRLVEDYGRHLSEVAQQASSAVDSYVHRAFLDVVELGRTPTLRDAVAAANRRPFDARDVARLDDIWRAVSPLPPAAAVLLSNPAARFLADLSQSDRTYVELLLTDRHGRLIAASNRVSDYDQSDEDWWKAAFDDGVIGRWMMSGVRWDESARRHAIEISVPVSEAGTDRLGGVLKVVADSREMLAFIGGLRFGSTGEAMLLLDDGTVVFSQEVVTPGARFFAADAFRERAASLRDGDPRQTSFFRAQSGDETFVVGLAASQLVATFPSLPWFVAVVQSEDELLAPMQSLGWYLLAAFALSALAVLIFALWFSMRIAAPPIESDLHLVHHSPVMHVGATDDPILAEEKGS